MEATALEIEQVNKWYAADVHAVRAIVTDVERTGRESLLFLNLPGMPRADGSRRGGLRAVTRERRAGCNWHRGGSTF